MLKETVEVIERTILPSGDYVSPGFSIIVPDQYFPNMIVGDTTACGWPYLRREISHNWYVDKRIPTVGFVSRDEAHILYNTALKFKGKKALEIGCWLGWSACHLALAGVELDVIDPLLARPDFYESVNNSLKAAGVLDAVNLIAGYSPQKVEELAVQFQRKWSLIFIDGNHEASGPLNDAIVCEQLAEADALILFHDLASPNVAQGLDYLKQQGWQTMVYQTMQIMGVAWRGNVDPVRHQPDPTINWSLPTHLKNYIVSGMSNNQSVEREVCGRQVQEIKQQAVDEAIAPFLNQLFHYVEEFKNSSSVQAANLNFDREKLAKWNNCGQEFFINGDMERSIAAFTKAIEVNPSSIVTHQYLSSLYWQTGDFQKSLQHHILAQPGNIAFGSGLDEEFRELLAAVRPYTMLSEARLFSLYSLARQICLDDIPGNFVECGTWKGGAAALLAVVIQRYSLRPRVLYAFDTYEGMPDPTEVDRHNGIDANLTGFGAGTLKAPISENLDVVCQSLNVRDIVIPIQGLFAQTLPQAKAEIGSIALLHADGDWYESTMDIFNTLYDSVVPNGVIQIDDYGHWEGCRKAIHKFERRRGESFALRAIDYTGVWFQKEDPVHQECNHWRTFWHLAQTAQKMGNVELAEKAAQAVLKIMPRLVKAENLLDRHDSRGEDVLPPQILDLGELDDSINNLSLREVNLIMFPDWGQPEEVLCFQLKGVIRTILTHPDKSKMAVLLDTSNISEEDANLVLSGVMMNLLMQEDLDLTDALEISLVGKLSQMQWSALLPRLHYRIVLENENKQAVLQARAESLPALELDNFSSLELPQHTYKSLSVMDENQIWDELAKYNFYHTIKLTENISTPGLTMNPAHMQDVPLRALRSLDIKNKRVLDIGCRDGLFSFEAEKLGAEEIIGIDNDLSLGAVNFLIPFFSSKVKMYELNLLDLKPETFGMFDIVIFPGVLYHLRYPFWALKLIKDVLREGGQLIIETAVYMDDNQLAMLFCPTGSESPYEPTSCTFFNLKGLIDTLCSLGLALEDMELLNYVWPVTSSEITSSNTEQVNPYIDRVTLICSKQSDTENTIVSSYWNSIHDIHTSMNFNLSD